MPLRGMHCMHCTCIRMQLYGFVPRLTCTRTPSLALALAGHIYRAPTFRVVRGRRQA